MVEKSPYVDHESTKKSAYKCALNCVLCNLAAFVLSYNLYSRLGEIVL